MHRDAGLGQVGKPASRAGLPFLAERSMRAAARTPQHAAHDVCHVHHAHIFAGGGIADWGAQDVVGGQRLEVGRPGLVGSTTKIMANKQGAWPAPSGRRRPTVLW